jgi:hypothetical protein
MLRQGARLATRLRIMAMKPHPIPDATGIMKSIPRRTIFVLGMYVGAAVLTFGFQTYVRLDQCSGSRACAISIAKGLVWSAVWPASWPVFAAGFKRAP